MQLLQQLAHRPVVRDRIRHGCDCVEPEDPVLATAHDASPVRLVAAGVLHVVVACGVCFPDVDFDVGDRAAGCVFECADDEEGFTLGVVRHGVTGGDFFGVVCVEGAQDGAFG